MQRADSQDKEIVEIGARGPHRFQGSRRFSIGRRDRDRPIPLGETLRNVRGICLIVHRDTGQQYVGRHTVLMALGRWKSYADGHGRASRLKELSAPADAFDVAILEVVGGDDGGQEIFPRETQWKKKLGTRASS